MYLEAETERWDREWLSYLIREYPHQLKPYSAYPDRPALPENPADMLNVELASCSALSFYAPASAIEGKRVLEFGCGCGNLGKLLGRYVDHYLGVDCSGLALAIARLVSPSNTTYLHVSDTEKLAAFNGTIDTQVSRFFWIHQNFETGRRVLRFVEQLLRTGGRIYMDFFWPNPSEAVGFWRDVLYHRSPDEPLNDEPSMMFRYSEADVAALLADTSFRLVHQEEHGPTQRRYVVAERC